MPILYSACDRLPFQLLAVKLWHLFWDLRPVGVSAVTLFIYVFFKFRCCDKYHHIREQINDELRIRENTAKCILKKGEVYFKEKCCIKMYSKYEVKPKVNSQCLRSVQALHFRPQKKYTSHHIEQERGKKATRGNSWELIKPKAWFYFYIYQKAGTQPTSGPMV